MRTSFMAAGLAGVLLLGGAAGALAEDISVPMKSVGIKSLGDTVGTVDVSETVDGVAFKLRMRDMPRGENWVLLSDSRACPDKLGQVEGKRLGMVDTGAEETGEVANIAAFDSPGTRLADLKRHAILLVHEMPGDRAADPLARYREPQVACGTLD